MTDFARQSGGYGVAASDAQALAGLHSVMQQIPQGRQDALSAASGVFAKLLPRIRSEIGGDMFKAWIEPLRVMDADGAHVVLAAPNAFAASRVSTDYLHRLQARWDGCAQSAQKIRIVSADDQAFATRELAACEPAKANPVVTDLTGRPGAGELFEMGATTRQFENFAVGDSNRVAAALAMRVADEPGHGDIILFHGANGLGKSHLVEAIAHRMRTSGSRRRIVMLTAQRFLNEFQAALRERDTMPFKAALRSADVLLIDDLQLICGKAVTQDEFFQTVDDLLGRGKTVVCTADVPVEGLEGLSPRMRGILQGGYTARLTEPDFELRRAIAKIKSEELNAKKGSFVVPEEALDLIAARVIGSGRAVEGALKQVFAASALIGQEATMEVVVEAIEGTWRAPEKKVPVDVIKRRVAAHFDLSLEDLISQRRHRSVARPRQIAMYFCKRLTNRSFPDIGQRFGGRDHTTVMHAVKRVEELALSEPSFAAELQEIGRKITD
jgi:chromosomal replication initiator protein